MITAQSLFHFLLKNPYIFHNLRGFSTANPTVYEFLVLNHDFSPKSAAKIASVVRLTNPDRSDSVLSFLKQSGFSPSQLEKTLKLRPDLLSADLHKAVKPKIDFFRDSGFSAGDVAEIISNEATILRSSLTNRIIPALAVLNRFWSSNDVATILKASGRFLTMDLDKYLVPNVKLLKKCGISMDQINSIVFGNPRILLCNPERMQKCIDRAVEMGVPRSSKAFSFAIIVIGSMTDETWEVKLRTFQEAGLSNDDIKVGFRNGPMVFGSSMEVFKQKLRTFRGMGFSDGDIARAFRNSPRVFSLSEKRIKEAIEVIVGSGKYDLCCIVNYPACLVWSIEKRIKPRLRVVELLESKKLIQTRPGLRVLFSLTDKKFNDKFVSPFLDKIGDN